MPVLPLPSYDGGADQLEQFVVVSEYLLTPMKTISQQGVSYTPDRTIHAMNPAHMIFECLTNREWGRGLDRALIDEESFYQTALILAAENFGLCLRWSRAEGINTFIQHVLDTISAVMFTSRETALIKLKLIRGGYDPSTLPNYTTENGILEISENTNSTASGFVNEVVVKYLYPPMNEKREVRVQNLAALQSSGSAFNTKIVEYLGIPVRSLARKVATRELMVYSSGLRRFRFTMDRRGWRIEPGSVIKISDPVRKINEVIVRVAKIEDGTMTNGRITITAVQDIFGSTWVGDFSTSEPQHYTPPTVTPCIGRHEVFEIPYFLLNGVMSEAEFNTLNPESAMFGTVVEQGRLTNTNYSIAVRPSAPTSDDWPPDSSTYCGYTPP